MQCGGLPGRRNVAADLIIPVLALVFVAYYLTTITEVPWISQASAVFVGVLLTLAIVAYFARTVSRVRRGVETISFAHLAADLPTEVKRVILLSLTIAYVLVLEFLGFTVTTFLFLVSGIILLSSLANWRAAVLTALGCSLGGYLVFIVLFETRFPKGWVEHTLEALMSGS